MTEEQARPTPILPCPKPYKKGYSSEGEAKAGFIVGPYTRPHRPYRCRCGKWHMTSSPIRETRNMNHDS